MPHHVVSPSDRQNPWPVMVLAHNEARHIAICLDSLYTAEPGRKFIIFVIANGCTDNTEDVVRGYAATHPQVRLVSIAMADKCNAWNVYIHEVLPTSGVASNVYFFMDGDARACPGALSALSRAIEQHPDARAAAAVPVTGRSMKRDREQILVDHGLVANLYALSNECVNQLQQKRVRLPLRLEGDDGLLGALLKWDLDPRREWDRRRIVPCADAGFAFESMSWRRLDDWKRYWRRRVRYGRRRYEFSLLAARLKRSGITALPADIREVYADSRNCRLQWSGIQTLFNWLALREIRRSAKSLMA